jgi:hypothetical protein
MSYELLQEHEKSHNGHRVQCSVVHSWFRLSKSQLI